MWKRIIAPTLLVSLLWVIVSVSTTIYISWLYGWHERLLSQNVATIQAAAGMEDVLWRIQAVVVGARETGRLVSRAEVADLRAAFEHYLADAESAAMTGEERAVVGTIRKQFSSHLEKVADRLELDEAPSEGRRVRIGDTFASARMISQSCKQILELNEKRLAESNAATARLAYSVRTVRIGFVVTGPLIGIAFGILVARGFRRSVSEISVTLEDATGDLSQEMGRVQISRTGELPELQQQVAAVSAQIKRVVGELHQARHDMIRAERLAAVGWLAAGVAHELRNPLTSVKLLIQTAAKRYPERPLSLGKLRVIEEEIDRMENTIQSLLDFGRPAPLNRVQHDLRETLQRALNLVEGRAAHQSVLIDKCWPDEPVHVDGDPEQLHQVFVNLLLNGIESMSEGGKLCVAIDPKHDAGACRILFSDSGCGVPQAVMERIFEPFVTSKERGTGLGLAISRRIIQEHGGAIFAENQETGGAIFTVELPLTHAPAPSMSGNGQGPSLAGTVSLLPSSSSGDT